MSDTLTRLAQVLEERKGAAADSSYVASLYHKGLNKILEKVGEESVETIIAAKDAAISGDCSDVIYEPPICGSTAWSCSPNWGSIPRLYWMNWTVASVCPDTPRKPRARPPE